jgi:hypothetical protein
MQKLKLSDLKIESFVTDLTKNEAQTVQGGLITSHLGGSGEFTERPKPLFSQYATCEIYCAGQPPSQDGVILPGPQLP